MKRTHALIAAFALMSMTVAAQVASAQEGEQGVSLDRVVSSQIVLPAQWGGNRASAMAPIVGDKAHSKQTRRMALGKC